MARDGLVVEARTLTRCCYENLIWAAALNERGSDFVADMLNDEAASRKAVGQTTLKLTSRAGADSDAGDAKLLRDLIRQSEMRFPEGKKLHVDKTALGTAVELVYATYGQLSLDSAHPTISALGRYLHSEFEGGTRHLVIDVMPSVPEKEVLRTLQWACEALLGVIVASNQIVGGTATNDAIRQAFDEAPGIFKLDSPDSPAADELEAQITLTSDSMKPEN